MFCFHGDRTEGQSSPNDWQWGQPMRGGGVFLNGCGLAAELHLYRSDCSHYNSQHALFRQEHWDASCMTVCWQRWPRTEQEKKRGSDMFSPEGRRRVAASTHFNRKWSLNPTLIRPAVRARWGRRRPELTRTLKSQSVFIWALVIFRIIIINNQQLKHLLYYLQS